MSKLVQAIGPKDADILIVGEAPGKQEVRQGKPFVGRSGKLLTKLLAKAGILRSMCRITNVVKERPKNNSIKQFIDLSKKQPRVTKAGQSYLDSFRREVAQLSPNVIIAVGGVSTWALTQKRGVTKWRGSIITDELGRKVVPTIHPAAALRKYIYRHYILFDLYRAKDESKSPELDRTEREYILKPTFEECVQYLNDCLTQDLVAFDIEVNRNKEVSCISFSYSKHHAISIPFLDSYGALYFLQEQEKALWLLIEKVLSSKTTKCVAHNASFDSTFLYRKYGIVTRNIEDTMIAQGILYPDFKKGLGFVTTQYTDIPYYKDDGKKAMKAQNSRKFWLYNAKDSIVLSETFPKQKRDLKKQNNWQTYKAQRDLLEPLTFMTEIGMRVDVEGLRAKRDETAQKIEDLERELINITGRALNPRSVKQLKQYFYGDEPGDLGLKPYKSRSTGRPTTDETALKRLSRRGFEAASVLLEIRGLEKMRGTYYNMKLHDDNRLRSSFNPIGTSTGRISSSKDIFGKGGNMQNLPIDFKKHIKPDPGHVLYEVDLGQAENRIVAYLGSDKRMMQAFEDGEDIHSKTAGLIFDIDVDKVKAFSKRAKQGDTSTELFPDIGQGNKSHRGWGKQANHAFNYNMGYRKAALRWEIKEKQAKWIREKYYAAYPGVKRFHARVDKELNDNRTVQNLLGRNRRFLGRWSKIKEDAYSHMAQSTVADIINKYGVNGLYYNQEKFSDLTLLLQVHDSVIFQISKDLAWTEHARLLDELCTMMEPELSYRGNTFTIPAEVTILPRHAAYGHEFSERPTGEALHKAYHSFDA